MKSDEAKRRIEQLVNRDELVRAMEERSRVQAAEDEAARVAEQARRERRAQRRRARALATASTPVPKDRGLPANWKPEDMLERFTAEQAFAFIYAHTVPPANDDGPALLAAYPELAAAAPELVADMAVAFRIKTHDEYAGYFSLVAKQHGIDCTTPERVA